MTDPRLVRNEKKFRHGPRSARTQQGGSRLPTRSATPFRNGVGMGAERDPERDNPRKPPRPERAEWVGTRNLFTRDERAPVNRRPGSPEVAR